MLKQFHCSNSSPKPSMPLLQAEQTLGTVLLDISSMHAVCQQSITGLDSIVEQALHAHLRAQSSSQQNLGQSTTPGVAVTSSAHNKFNSIHV